MKNWKKWLSAGLLAAVLGAAGISAPATVSANAGYLPYDRIDNLAPEETMARVRVFQVLQKEKQPEPGRKLMVFATTEAEKK